MRLKAPTCNQLIPVWICSVTRIKGIKCLSSLLTLELQEMHHLNGITQGRSSSMRLKTSVTRRCHQSWDTKFLSQDFLLVLDLPCSKLASLELECPYRRHLKTMAEHKWVDELDKSIVLAHHLILQRRDLSNKVSSWFLLNNQTKKNNLLRPQWNCHFGFQRINET